MLGPQKKKISRFLRLGHFFWPMFRGEVAVISRLAAIEKGHPCVFPASNGAIIRPLLTSIVPNQHREPHHSPTLKILPPDISKVMPMIVYVYYNISHNFPWLHSVVVLWHDSHNSRTAPMKTAWLCHAGIREGTLWKVLPDFEKSSKKMRNPTKFKNWSLKHGDS